MLKYAKGSILLKWKKKPTHLFRKQGEKENGFYCKASKDAKGYQVCKKLSDRPPGSLEHATRFETLLPPCGSGPDDDKAAFISFIFNKLQWIVSILCKNNPKQLSKKRFVQEDQYKWTNQLLWGGSM